MSREFRVFESAEVLAAAAAELLFASVSEMTENKREFNLALSGGNTPRLLYKQLCRQNYDKLPWESVSLFWGDERFVPAEHEQSNFRMVKETLLDSLPVGPKSVNRVNTGLPSAAESALDYERKLRKRFTLDSLQAGWPQFDCILLGIGTDGHTASLFPDDTAVSEQQRWVTIGNAPTGGQRITLTLPVLNAARMVIFLVSGIDKADVVARIAAGAGDHFPAAMVQAEQVLWLCDIAAASQLPSIGKRI